MKKLAELARYLDESLNFLIACRHRGENTHMLLFSEVKASVERTYARSLTQNHFRQLLSVVPDLYSHDWEKNELVIGY